MKKYLLFFALALSISAQNILGQKKDIKDNKPSPYKDIGFSEEFTSLIVLGGTGLMPPSGTLIENEKNYDKHQIAKAMTGINRFIGGIPGFYNQPKYEVGNYFGIESERAFSDNVSYGFGFTWTSVQANRQRIHREFLSAGYDGLSLPQKMDIYKEVALTGMLSYHFFTKTQWDPYVKARLGLARAYSDDIHHGMDFDIFRMRDTMSNGKALLMGLSGGLNYHINEAFYTLVEISYFRRYVQSDQFSRRNLDTWYVNIGAGINFFDIGKKLK